MGISSKFRSKSSKSEQTAAQATPSGRAGVVTVVANYRHTGFDLHQQVLDRVDVAEADCAPGLLFFAPTRYSPLTEVNLT